MRILLLYTHNQSFLASFFYELAENLRSMGYLVKVYSLKENASSKTVPPWIEFGKKSNYWSNSWKIFTTIRNFSPDVIISNFSYVNAALLSGKILRVKRNIVWFHTLTQQLNASPRQIFIKSNFLKLASKIIVNSTYLKQDLRKNYNIDADKIIAVPFWAGIKPTKYKPDHQFKNCIKIGCPGRLEEVKNQRILLNALSNLKTNVKVELYLAGHGKDKEYLIQKTEELQLKDRINFLGVLNIKQMQDFYNNMDIIVLPSKFEAFGLVLIEALSLNRPVLVSNKFGALNYIKDVEFNKNYTFDPNDVDDLSTKLNEMISNKKMEGYYFNSIYQAYFQKEKIINQIEEIIIS